MYAFVYVCTYDNESLHSDTCTPVTTMNMHGSIFDFTHKSRFVTSLSSLAVPSSSHVAPMLPMAGRECCLSVCSQVVVFVILRSEAAGGSRSPLLRPD